ncbi:hypothetical protein [Haloarchaeobius sp. DYHT-AS-18]|uniref:hypothetical protein n=1 Tax=Haloarchaeobius sp. DYHT-AS-18 TaxID=3446117 RepID=UPI003EB6AA99
MVTSQDLISHHVTVLKRCGLSDAEICEVYGLSDPPDDISVEAVVEKGYDDEFTPRNLYDQTHRVLAASSRGIDAPRQYPNRVVPQQLETVFSAYGFHIHFLDDEGNPIDTGVEPTQPFRIALEDPNGNRRATSFSYPDTSLGEHNYPALIAAVEEGLLDGVPLTFAMLSNWADDRWRFVLFEGKRLDALESHYGDGIEAFGEPLLHDQRPAEFVSELATRAASAAPSADKQAASTSTSGSGTTGSSDGDIGVDESTEGWLGDGMADLSEVDLESEDDEPTKETAETETADDSALDSIFSEMEAAADPSGETGVEVQSTGKSVRDLFTHSDDRGSESTPDEVEEPASPGEKPPAPESEPEPEPEPEPVATETPAAETEPAQEPEPIEVSDESEPVAAAEAPAEAEATEAERQPTAVDSEPAGDGDDGGFVMADPEPVEDDPDLTPNSPDPGEPAQEASSQPEVDEEPEPAAAATPVEPVTDSEPEPADEAASDPEPEPEPVAAPAPEQTRDPEPDAAPADEAASAPEPEPMQAAAPESVQESEPVEETEPADESEPATEPESEPEPEPEPAPRPSSKPSQGPDPVTFGGASDDESKADDEPAEKPSSKASESAESPGIIGRLVGALKGLF